MLRLPPRCALVVLVLLSLCLAPAASARHVADVPHVVEEPVELDPPPAEPEPFGLTMPIEGTITSRFGPRWGRMHHGLDIGMLPQVGVVAAAAGRVTKTGYLPNFAGYGKVILIAHGQGYQTLYSHLSRVRVVPGDEVEARDWIGNAGCTGWCTGTHLHFELRRRGVPIDPLPFLVREET